MKKYLILIPILMFLLATNLWATTITDTDIVGNGLFGNATWANATLEWSVTDPAQSGVGHWLYTYTFDSNDHNISHVIVEVSDNFTTADMLAGTTLGALLDTYSGNDPSNPNLPGTITGIKWNSTSDSTSMSVTIVTDRAPVEGIFYAVNGQTPGAISYAYSDGSRTGAASDGNIYTLPLVPDSTTTETVPEPMSLVLLGSGLIGASLVVRKRRRGIS